MEYIYFQNYYIFLKYCYGIINLVLENFMKVKGFVEFIYNFFLDFDFFFLLIIQ